MNLLTNISKSNLKNLMHDIVREITIIVVIHLLTNIIDNSGELFSEKVLKHIFYTVIALIIFNLFTKKIFIKIDKENDEDYDLYKNK